MTASREQPRRRPSPRVRKQQPPEMTHDEIVSRHPEQWILMRVTGFNEYRHPSRGYVLAASPDEQVINDALAREPRPSSLASDAPRPLYYAFQAYPRIYSGEGWLARLAQLDDEDDLDAAPAEG